MKKLFILSILCLCIGNLFGQESYSHCGSLEHSKSLSLINPDYSNARSQYENAVTTWISKNSQPTVQSSITIPVVVHVVWKTSPQNIPDSQIVSQIDVLNEDYGRTNPDTVNTPAGFLSVAANTGIQFCLAQIDPLGNPTTGIERIPTLTTAFTTNDNVKHSSSSGADAWDPTRYLNIWVCNLSGGILGYAEFPTGTVSQTFGVVIQYNTFGRVGTLLAPFDNGRTCTHEIAHCFNLFHISANSSCIDNDQCADTPVPSSTLLSSCPTFPLLDACNPISPGVMFMNYMTNAPDDDCMNLFTLNQSARMNAVLNIAPYNALATSNACVPLGINDPENYSHLISIFPNPSSGIVKVNFPSQQISKIIVLDVLGNVIGEYSRNPIKNDSFEIDLSDQSNGVYFLQIITQENKLVNRKIILSH